VFPPGGAVGVLITPPGGDVVAGLVDVIVPGGAVGVLAAGLGPGGIIKPFVEPGRGGAVGVFIPPPMAPPGLDTPRMLAADFFADGALPRSPDSPASISSRTRGKPEGASAAAGFRFFACIDPVSGLLPASSASAAAAAAIAASMSLE
jgi:hypothetical protein